MIGRRHWTKPQCCLSTNFTKYFCLRYTTKSAATQKQRSEKELRRLFKQTKVSKNVELAAKSLKPAHQKIEFTESPYPKQLNLGEKKDVRVPLPSHYTPQFFECYWYEWWEKNGFFKPRNRDGKIFSMVLPPPNVTGKLHIGHALTCAVEDALVRWKTMSGEEALWLPGTDHAGIATQVVVERQLEHDRGETRFDLGRDGLTKVIWDWKKNKGDNINHQLRKLGASLDWNRSVFTLDPNYAYAVIEAFIRLFEEGLIYRDECCVNWCCHLQSTVSDLEVETKVLERPALIPVPGYDNPVQFGTMHELAYKLCEPVGDVTEIVVGTTRLETVAGDEAVAVHPNDPRYSSFVGKRVQHPFILGKTIPIIADEAVEMDFGTGALKVSPAHDFTDFEIGKRHGLPLTSVISADGKMQFERPNVPEYAMKSYKHLNDFPRFDARTRVLTHLINASLYRGARPQNSVLRLCSRSGDVIEPMVKKQWFIRTEEMAKKVLEAFDSGELKIVHQAMYEKSWRDWLRRGTPWCISRQIWWGHRIPAYKCTNENNGKSFWVAAHSQLDATEKAQKKCSDVDKSQLKIEQDTDVLDTWFSSALHPFASLGWPKKTEDLERYYPLSLMETGGDLIHFWVSRMAMLGMKLTGQLPFRQVLFHPMVRDKYNRKMSKSVGNVVDPIHVISGVDVEDRVEGLKEFGLHREDTLLAVEVMKNNFGGNMPVCGSDALRMALLQHNLDAQGIQFDISEAIVARRFCNKVLNSFKFLLQYISEEPKFARKIEEIRSIKPKPDLNVMDVFATSLLIATADQCDKALKEYKFHEALQSVKKLWFNLSMIYLRYCYVYLGGNIDEIPSEYGANRVDDELIEDRDKMTIIANLIDVIDGALRLLSPFAPFLSEELWQRIPSCLLEKKKADSLCLSTYPTVANIKGERSVSAERAVERMWDTVEFIRQEKVLYFLPQNMDVIIVAKKDEIYEDFKLMEGFMDIFFACNKFEVLPYSKYEALKETCIGNINEDDDVIIMYRFTPSEFQNYLVEKNIEKHFQSRKESWVKRVEKLEAKARSARNPEKFKKSLLEILKECDKYLKIERFAESVARLKSKTS